MVLNRNNTQNVNSKTENTNIISNEKIENNTVENKINNNILEEKNTLDKEIIRLNFMKKH